MDIWLLMSFPPGGGGHTHSPVGGNFCVLPLRGASTPIHSKEPLGAPGMVKEAAYVNQWLVDSVLFLQA